MDLSLKGAVFRVKYVSNNRDGGTFPLLPNLYDYVLCVGSVSLSPLPYGCCWGLGVGLFATHTYSKRKNYELLCTVQ